MVQTLPLRSRRHHLRARHMAALPEAGKGHTAHANSLLTVSFCWLSGPHRVLFPGRPQIEMLDYRTRRLEMEPVAWNESALSSVLRDPSALEFRKIVCEGDFDKEKSVFIGPRSRSISGVTENGYYVITPLIPRSTPDR